MATVTINVAVLLLLSPVYGTLDGFCSSGNLLNHIVLSRVYLTMAEKRGTAGYSYIIHWQKIGKATA
jgi:hypothetical protein